MAIMTAGLLTRFIKRMLPDARQLLTSGIRIGGGACILGIAHYLPLPWHDWAATLGKVAIVLGVFPLITRPEGVVTDAIADLVSKPDAREKVRLWWTLQTTFNGDQQAMDRVHRNVSGRHE